MSVSRDSAMADYHFTGKRFKGSFKVNANTTIKLSTIPDMEEHQILETPNSIKRVSSIASTPITKRDIQELLALDLSTDCLPLPHKRVIFISIAQLNACIDDIPSYILSESIFCFKAERCWFFPSNHSERKQSRQSIRHKLNFNQKFLQTLHEKDANKLILWLQDNKSWTHISHELSQIEDIFYTKTNKTKDESPSALSIPHSSTTGQPQPNDIPQPIEQQQQQQQHIKQYDPLQLDTSWWLNNFANGIDNNIQSLYCDQGIVFVHILYSLNNTICTLYIYISEKHFS